MFSFNFLVEYELGYSFGFEDHEDEPFSKKTKNMAESDELAKVKADLEKKSREMQELKDEMDKMKSLAAKNAFAFDFNVEQYKQMCFIDSAVYAAKVLKVAMKERMMKNKSFFEPFQLVRGCKQVNAKTCARFNQGSNCYDQWHVNQKLERKPEQSTSADAQLTPKKRWSHQEDLRLHCCVLCMEALEIISGHPLVRCPWVREVTWTRIEKIVAEKNGA